MSTEQVCCVMDFTQNPHQIYNFLSDLLSILVDTVELMVVRNVCSIRSTYHIY